MYSPKEFEKAVLAVFIRKGKRGVSQSPLLVKTCLALFNETVLRSKEWASRQQLAKAVYDSDDEFALDKIKKNIMRIRRRLREYSEASDGKNSSQAFNVIDNQKTATAVRDKNNRLLVAYKLEFTAPRGRHSTPAQPGFLGRYAGRKNETTQFNEMLGRLHDHALNYNVLCVHGFGGIGKTSLLEIFRNLAREQGIKVEPRLPRDEIVTTSVDSWLSDVFLFNSSRQGALRRENWRDFFEVLEPGTLVLMDTLSRVDMEELSQTLTSLSTGFQKEKKECLIATATRQRPALRSQALELSGLSTDEIKELAKIRQWNEEVMELADEIQRQTDGIPLMVECLCEDAELWERFKLGKLDLTRHAQPVSLVLGEMWHSLADNTKQAMKTAALLARDLAECKILWGREQCLGLLGGKWDDAFIELKSKSLIKETGPDHYDVHELVSSFVISRIDNLPSLCEDIGDYFTSVGNDEIALRFLVRSHGGA